MKFLLLILIAQSAWALNIPVNIGAPQSGSPSGNPLASNFIPAFNYSGPTWVYTYDISTKPFQNAAGQGTLQTIKMSGVRNEVLGYQVCLKAPSLLSNLNVEMSLPTHTQFSTTLSTQSATSAGNFRIYVSSYVAIDTMTATAAHGDYYGVSHALVPDPLIPHYDPYYNQLTNVFPMTVQSGNTQCFWIEGFLPTGIASGYYGFNVTIATGATPSVMTVIATVPGAVEVFDSTMTVTPAMAMVNGEGYAAMCVQAYGGPTSSNCAPYRPDLNGGSGDTASKIAVHDTAVYYLDHKMTISGSNGAGDTAANYKTIFGHLVEGSVSGTYLNTIIPGAHFTTLQAQFIGSSHNTAQQFLNIFGSSTTVFNYICDEPGNPPGGSWALCQTNINGIASGGTPVGNRNLITATYNNFNVEGDTAAVQMMVPLGENLHTHGGDYTAWLAANPLNILGSYWDCISSNGYCIAGFTGTGSGHPNPHIDGRPVNQQAMPITVALSSGTVLLNSSIDQCWTSTIVGNSSGGCGTGSTAIKNGMLNFGEGGAGSMLYAGQGDETWGYPGTSTWLGASVSTPIYVGSIRIQEIMAGIQYLDYRTILTSNGLDSYFWAQLATWMTDDENFNQDPYNNGSFSGTITSARQNMGCTIHKIKWPGATCGW